HDDRRDRGRDATQALSARPARGTTGRLVSGLGFGHQVVRRRGERNGSARWYLAVRRTNDRVATPALDASRGVLLLDAADCAFVVRPCDRRRIARRTPTVIHATHHSALCRL